MKINEATSNDTVSLDDIWLDYDALQYDVKVSKPEITVYFDQTGKISGIDTVELQVLATQALPTKMYIGVEYDPVEYSENFSLETLTDDIYEIEETDSGFSLTTDNIQKLVKDGLNATFEREIIWPFDNESVHDQLNKNLDRIKSFEGKVIYYVTGQIVGTPNKKNPIPGIELSDGFKTAQKEYLKDAGKKQEKQKIRQGRTDFQMLVDSIKGYPNVKNVQVIDRKAGRDFTKQVRITGIANKWNPKLKKRIPERVVIDLLSNTEGTHLLARILGQVFNGYETRSWEQMDKWLKNTYQVQYAAEEEDVSADWGKDMDASDEASLDAYAEQNKEQLEHYEAPKNKKKMNLYEALQILEKEGLKIIK